MLLHYTRQVCVQPTRGNPLAVGADHAWGSGIRVHSVENCMCGSCLAPRGASCFTDEAEAATYDLRSSIFRRSCPAHHDASCLTEERGTPCRASHNGGKKQQQVQVPTSPT